MKSILNIRKASKQASIFFVEPDGALVRGFVCSNFEVDGAFSTTLASSADLFSTQTLAATNTSCTMFGVRLRLADKRFKELTPNVFSKSVPDALPSLESKGQVKC